MYDLENFSNQAMTYNPVDPSAFHNFTPRASKELRTEVFWTVVAIAFVVLAIAIFLKEKRDRETT